MLIISAGKIRRLSGRSRQGGIHESLWFSSFHFWIPPAELGIKRILNEPPDKGDAKDPRREKLLEHERNELVAEMTHHREQTAALTNHVWKGCSRPFARKNVSENVLFGVNHGHPEANHIAPSGTN